MELLLQMLRQAEAERDEALAASGRARAAEQTAMEQQRQLASYRQDYEQRWHGHFRNGGAITTMVAFTAFNGRIGDALQQQERTVEQLRAQRAHAESVLLERERKVASTAKLIERRLAEAKRSETRREAKLEDERAARVAAANAARTPQGEQL